MATTVTDCGNVRIITQVVQQMGAQSSEVDASRMLGSHSTVSQIMSPQIKKIKNILPKALGAVQIVLGATQISFGIVLTLAKGDLKTLTVKSGVYFWIGILLLFSGSLLVEMEKREHVWLVKASLFANLLVCMTALIATILHATEIAQEKKTCDDNPTNMVYCSINAKVLAHGLNSVFLILSLLEISTAVTALVIGFRGLRQQRYQHLIA